MKRQKPRIKTGNVVFWRRLDTIVPAVVLDTSRCWHVRIGYGEGKNQQTQIVLRKELSLTLEIPA